MSHSRKRNNTQLDEPTIQVCRTQDSKEEEQVAAQLLLDMGNLDPVVEEAFDHLEELVARFSGLLMLIKERSIKQ